MIDFCLILELIKHEAEEQDFGYTLLKEWNYQKTRMNEQNQEIQQQQIHKRQLLWTPQIIDFQFTITHGVVVENGKGGSSYFLSQGKSSW